MAWLAGNEVWGDSLKCDVMCIVYYQHDSNHWEWKMNWKEAVIATSSWEDRDALKTWKEHARDVWSSYIVAAFRTVEEE